MCSASGVAVLLAAVLAMQAATELNQSRAEAYLEYRDNGKENGNYHIIVGHILGIFKGYIGIMEKKMETTFGGLGCKV